jgi:hypothetical protein
VTTASSVIAERQEEVSVLFANHDLSLLGKR